MGVLTQANRLARSLGNLLHWGSTPPPRKVYVKSRNLDNLRSYVADKLTFARLKTLVRSADTGDVATLLSLFEEMESRDLRLNSVANTRRNALTKLEWEVVSAAETVGDRINKKLADEAATYVEEVLSDLDGFDVALEHLATAIGPNVAVAELIWHNFTLKGIDPIPSERLIMHPDDLTEVRIVTEDEYMGERLKPGKWIVHTPHARAGFPFKCTISQAQAFVYLMKFLAKAGWSGYVEIYGQPVRWGTLKGNVSKEDQVKALDMLQNMGASAYGLFSEAVTLSMIESTDRGTSPHEALINWCDRETAIAWLGSTLAVDSTGATGTLSTAKVHDGVRMDLLEDDVRREARTIRRDLIAPLCAYRFAGQDVPLPIFRRVFKENIDRTLEADVMAKAQVAGVTVPRDWAYDRLGIPKPEADEEILEPSLGAFGDNLNEGF